MYVTHVTFLTLSYVINGHFKRCMLKNTKCQINTFEQEKIFHFLLLQTRPFVSNVCHCCVSFVSYHFNPFTPVSATDTDRLYSVWRQTILVNGEPLGSERVKINIVELQAFTYATTAIAFRNSNSFSIIGAVPYLE